MSKPNLYQLQDSGKKANETEFKQPQNITQLILVEDQKKEGKPLLSIITENSQNEKNCTTATDEITENKKYIENLINSIDQRINITDNILKQSFDKKRNLQIQDFKKALNEKQSQNIQKINMKFEQKGESGKNKVQIPKIMNKSEKTEIKININKGTDYTKTFKIMKLKKENIPPKKDESFMMEILKIKKKDILRDVQTLEKEISNLEKEKAKESKDRFMESQKYINSLIYMTIYYHYLAFQDIQRNSTQIQEKFTQEKLQ